MEDKKKFSDKLPCVSGNQLDFTFIWIVLCAICVIAIIFRSITSFIKERANSELEENITMIQDTITPKSELDNRKDTTFNLAHWHVRSNEIEAIDLFLPYIGKYVYVEGRVFQVNRIFDNVHRYNNVESGIYSEEIHIQIGYSNQVIVCKTSPLKYSKNLADNYDIIQHSADPIAFEDRYITLKGIVHHNPMGGIVPSRKIIYDNGKTAVKEFESIKIYLSNCEKINNRAAIEYYNEIERKNRDLMNRMKKQSQYRVQ